MKKKGFTLIELLVVISIIAMLLAILMPALGRVKEMAMRVVCGANCRGIGTSMQIYASDYDDSFPVAGEGTNAANEHDEWGSGADLTGWDALPEDQDWSGTDNNLTISASLYQLIREADGDPAIFVCKSDEEKAFEGKNAEDLDLTELYDFGGSSSPDGENPIVCVSYAYHQPYRTGANNGRGFPANGSKGSSFAVLADKNPWSDPQLSSFGGTYNVTGWESEVGPILDDWSNDNAPSNSKAENGVGNSNAHKRDGQNVLFGDGHVTFEKESNVGVKNDNIYTMHGGSLDKVQQGMGKSGAGAGRPQSPTDSYLVNDDTRTP